MAAASDAANLRNNGQQTMDATAGKEGENKTSQSTSGEDDTYTQLKQVQSAAHKNVLAAYSAYNMTPDSNKSLRDAQAAYKKACDDVDAHCTKINTNRQGSAGVQSQGTAKMSATFAVTIPNDPKKRVKSQDGRYVFLPVQHLFEQGDYPDKQFSVTNAELEEAAKNFQPVMFDIEHKPSVLDGKLGGLQAVHYNPPPQEAGKGTFSGIVATPNYLDEVLGPQDRGVSLSWSNKVGEPKRITGIAWTINPRIQGANADFNGAVGFNNALLHSFVNDEAVAGAMPPVPQPPSNSDNPSAGCVQGKDLAKKVMEMVTAAEKGTDPDIHSPKYMAWLSKLKAVCSQMGATAGGDDASEPTQMSASVAGATSQTPPPEAQFDAAAKAKIAELEAKLAAEADKRNKEHAEAVKKASFAFATEEVRANRSLPRDFHHLQKLYLDAASGDRALFNQNGVEGSLVNTLSALFSGRKTLGLTQEQLKQTETELQQITAGNFNQTVVTPGQESEFSQTPRPMTPERKASLMRAGSLGRVIYDERANGTAAKN